MCVCMYVCACARVSVWISQLGRQVPVISWLFLLYDRLSAVIVLELRALENSCLNVYDLIDQQFRPVLDASIYTMKISKCSK